MTTRLNALADRIAGQGFGLTNYGNLEADVNYLVVPGADIASANVISITNEFHKLTGTTTVNTINDALGLVAGQAVQFWIHDGPVIFSGSAGNIKTATGADRKAYQNEIVTFVYDGASWREVRPTPGARIAFGTKTSVVSTTSTTFAGGADLLAAALSFTADGVSTYILRLGGGAYLNNSTTGMATTVAVNLDGAQAGTAATFDSDGAGFHIPFSLDTPIITPAAGTHTVNLRIFNNSGGTSSAGAGAGGGTNNVPLILTLEVA